MKLKLLFFIAAVALIVTSCNSYDIVETDNTVQSVESTKHVLNITASFDESGSTRATLERNPSSIQFKWQKDVDEIQFCFVQDGAKITANAPVTDVSEDGRTAQFELPVPDEIDRNEAYTLYAFRSGRKSGITSGSELQANSTIAVLPVAQNSYFSTLSEQAIVFSIWSKKEIPANSDTEIPLTFQHLGSMATLNVKNIGDEAITDIHSFVLQANPQVDWIYNRFEGGGGAHFDLSTGNFVSGRERFSYTLTFIAQSKTIEAGDVGTYYIWFIPNPDVPKITLQLASLKSPGTELGHVTGSSNPNKTVKMSLEPGKNYVFFATIEVAFSSPRPYKIIYTDSSWVPYVPDDE